MTTDTEIKQAVRERYTTAALTKRPCCGSSTCTDAGIPDLSLDMIGEAYRGVDGYLPEADLGLGCGLPTQHAGIKEGDVVLDLGSGAGIDAFVARRIAGERGWVIGVDMTPEMIALARENAAKLGYHNVEFRLGEIEHLPIETSTVDVVVSNCVLNLVPNKARAFAEIFRVLRPAAHFCVSDIVATGELPGPIRHAAALYVGCIAGALPREHYLRLIEEAGFVNVEVVETKPIELPDGALHLHIDDLQITAFRGSGVSLQSITVREKTGTRTYLRTVVGHRQSLMSIAVVAVSDDQIQTGAVGANPKRGDSYAHHKERKRTCRSRNFNCCRMQAMYGLSHESRSRGRRIG